MDLTASALGELFGKLLNRLLHHIVPPWVWIIIVILGIIAMLYFAKSKKPKKQRRAKRAKKPQSKN